ncbi:past-1 [Gonapodya prolifera JEL478]|uniref:Past-1 n=1 Tax=Gonapodya prolifera (strain JEL478) TaxID=1344416 RepID=A0A139AKG8_GONPJ|nr:past-1 [Gonapodya prolifera JEL478]|eukprot:KXS17003.1 past-1 [Gonapodya prolifera JEL478]
MDGLKQLNRKKLRPLEELYKFEQFHSPPLTDSDVAAKPMVLLLGQYSVGKSTFIKYILEREYPGCNIGPEPTTDRFNAVMHAPDDRIIPGNAACVTADLPFTSLTRFGTSFLNRFQVSQMPSPVLSQFTLIDTPGILSGEKQRLGRQYDMNSVTEWFAERADLILLLFDAHKLDISDEFKEIIMRLKGNEDKIRVVLNKADQISGQHLLRCYGALMWSLGRVFSNPEVVRVYVGSFWDQTSKYHDMEDLLLAEQGDLLNMLRELPRNSAIRKVNEMVKRARTARVHAIIIAHLRKQMPTLFGAKSKAKDLLANLPREFAAIQRKFNIPPGDFPDPERFKQRLEGFELDKLPKYDKRVVAAAEELLSSDLPRLMLQFPQDLTVSPSSSSGAGGAGAVAGNPFQDILTEMQTFTAVSGNPFEDESPTSAERDAPGGPPRYVFHYDHIPPIDKSSFVHAFQSLHLHDGKITGGAARPALEATGLDKETLAKVWRLADWTKDGMLSVEEFVVAMWVCRVVREGWAELPAELPATLKPGGGR